MPVLRMEAPDLGFGFAWEPESQRLYIIHANGKIHEQIAARVASPEAATIMVNMWCSGYRSRSREITRAPGVKHYHMLAESGEVAVKVVALGKEQVT